MKFSIGITSLALIAGTARADPQMCCTYNFAKCSDGWCNTEERCGGCNGEWAEVDESSNCVAWHGGCSSSDECCSELACIADASGWKSCQLGGCTNDYVDFIDKKTWCGATDSNCEACGGVWTMNQGGKPVDPFAGCCTNDFKECIAKSEWCGRTPDKCDGCGSFWLTNGIQEDCTVRYKPCKVDDESPNNGCCDGLTCIDVEGWASCDVPAAEAP